MDARLYQQLRSGINTLNTGLADRRLPLRGVQQVMAKVRAAFPGNAQIARFTCDIEKRYAAMLEIKDPSLNRRYTNHRAAIYESLAAISQHIRQSAPGQKRRAKNNGQLSPEFIRARDLLNQMRVSLNRDGKLSIRQTYALRKALQEVAAKVPTLREASLMASKVDTILHDAWAHPLHGKQGHVVTKFNQPLVGRILEKIVKAMNSARRGAW